MSKEVYGPNGVQVNQGHLFCQTYDPIAHVKQMTLICMDLYTIKVCRFVFIKDFHCNWTCFINASNSIGGDQQNPILVLSEFFLYNLKWTLRYTMSCKASSVTCKLYNLTRLLKKPRSKEAKKQKKFFLVSFFFLEFTVFRNYIVWDIIEIGD